MLHTQNHKPNFASPWRYLASWLFAKTTELRLSVQWCRTQGVSDWKWFKRGSTYGQSFSFKWCGRCMHITELWFLLCLKCCMKLSNIWKYFYEFMSKVSWMENLGELIINFKCDFAFSGIETKSKDLLGYMGKCLSVLFLFA